MRPERRNKKHESRRDVEEKSCKDSEENDLPAFESTPKDDSDDDVAEDKQAEETAPKNQGDEVEKSGVLKTDPKPVAIEHVHDTQDTQIYSYNQDGQIFPVVANKSTCATAAEPVPVPDEPVAGPSHFGPTLVADADERTTKPGDPYEYHLSQSQHERHDFDKMERARKETRKRAQLVSVS